MRGDKRNSFRSLTLSLVMAGVLIAGSSQALGVITLLDPTSLTKYTDPLFIMPAAVPSGLLNGQPLYDLSVSQFQWQFSSQLPTAAVWGFNNTMPGPSFVVQSNQMIHVRYTNNLVNEFNDSLAHILPVDTTLMGVAGVPDARMVTHLHGGHDEAASDGGPWRWFSPDPAAPPTE
jgi:FtsP/CotA-like multicopper oxidase with cupredoxin domain